MESVIAIIVGVLIIIIGIINYRGNIKTIHWYHRTKISESNRRAYGRVVGIGTMIIGVGVMVTSIVELLFDKELTYIVLGTLVIGIGAIMYGQFKYNKGLF